MFVLSRYVKQAGRLSGALGGSASWPRTGWHLANITDLGMLITVLPLSCSSPLAKCMGRALEELP